MGVNNHHHQQPQQQVISTTSDDTTAPLDIDDQPNSTVINHYFSNEHLLPHINSQLSQIQDHMHTNLTSDQTPQIPNQSRDSNVIHRNSESADQSLDHSNIHNNLHTPIANQTNSLQNSSASANSTIAQDDEIIVNNRSSINMDAQVANNETQATQNTAPQSSAGQSGFRRGSLQLWQFLVALLHDPVNASCIAWTGRGMEFKLIEPEEVCKVECS